jgi:hypothetical protein
METVMPDLTGNPRYTGQFKYVDRKGGYGIWLPAGWQQVDMVEGHQGAVFYPDPNDPHTCFSTEKFILKYKVKRDDLPTLREGLEAGLRQLPGIEIESREETVSERVLGFDVRFMFNEGEARRKRWLRVIYWGEGQLVFIAQGATPELFEYYLPMFFNTMMTFEM